MNDRVFRGAAGAVALLGGVLGLVNPATAQVATTTIAGWALLFTGLLQGRAALRSSDLRVRAGAALFAAAGLFLGLSLVFGPFGDGTLMRWLLAGLLLVSGAAKLWIGRRASGDALYWALVAAGAVSLGLGALVGLGAGLPLGVIVSLELLVDGVALLIMALRPQRAPSP